MKGGDYMYRYISHVFCGGTLEDGKAWQGVRLVVARYRKASDKLPASVNILKMSKDFDVSDLNNLKRGCQLTLFFDEYGRIISIDDADC